MKLVIYGKEGIEQLEGIANKFADVPNYDLKAPIYSTLPF